MRCFMMRDGHVVMAAVLPEDIRNDEAAIVAGRAAFAAAAATATAPFDGFEIWDLERRVYDSAQASADEAPPLMPPGRCPPEPPPSSP